MNSSRWSSARWRLDEQETVDKQSQVEARGGRRWMNSSPWRLEEVDGGDEQYPVESRFAVRHTLPMNRTPVLTVALQHKSVFFVLRYATPLPINRTPISTVGGPFPPFCGTPDPSDEHDPISTVAGQTQGRFLRSVVRQASFPSPVPSKPVGSHAFRCLPMNMTHSVASP